MLFDVSHRIHTAQDARLGYSNLRVSYHSTAQLASNLFIRSFNQAEKTYTAMESRGYDGEINVIMPKINHSVKFNVFGGHIRRNYKQRLRYFQERRGFDV